MGAQGGLFGQIGTVAVVFILQAQIDALCDQVVVYGLHHHEGCLQTIVFRLLILRKCVPAEGVLPFQHEVFLLAEVKEGVPRGKGRSVVGIAPSGQTACAEGSVGEEGGDGCFRGLQQEVDGLYRIVFGKIVAFDGVHRLAMGKDLHPIEFRQPSGTIARASPHLGVPHQSPQCPFLEREVECCLLGHFEVFEQLHRLVIFEHTHRLHIAGLDVARGQSVVASQQVAPFDVEAVDGLALVTDFAICRNVDARDAAYDVFDVAVGLSRERRDAIGEGVTPLVHIVRLHRHFAKGLCALAELHVLSLRAVGEDDFHGFVTEMGEFQSKLPL